MKAFAAALALLMISTSSFAQSEHAPSPAEAQAAAGDWSALRMLKIAVFNEANEKIGEVSDLIITPQGQVMGVVLEVGNFLETRSHQVVVAMNSLKFSNEGGMTSGSTMKKEWYPDRAVLNVTKDELKAMSEIKN